MKNDMRALLVALLSMSSGIAFSDTVDIDCIAKTRELVASVKRVLLTESRVPYEGRVLLERMERLDLNVERREEKWGTYVIVSGGSSAFFQFSVEWLVQSSEGKMAYSIKALSWDGPKSLVGGLSEETKLRGPISKELQASLAAKFGQFLLPSPLSVNRVDHVSDSTFYIVGDWLEIPIASVSGSYLDVDPVLGTPRLFGQSYAAMNLPQEIPEGMGTTSDVQEAERIALKEFVDRGVAENTQYFLTGLAWVPRLWQGDRKISPVLMELGIWNKYDFGLGVQLTAASLKGDLLTSDLVIVDCHSKEVVESERRTKELRGLGRQPRQKVPDWSAGTKLRLLCDGKLQSLSLAEEILLEPKNWTWKKATAFLPGGLVSSVVWSEDGYLMRGGKMYRLANIK